jgi:hypothetical protein
VDKIIVRTDVSPDLDLGLVLPGRFELLDSVSPLKIQQPVPQAQEDFSVAGAPLLLEALANQIEHGSKRAEAVFVLDVELQARLVHGYIVQRGS